MELVILTAQQTNGTGGERKGGDHDGVMLTAPNRKSYKGINCAHSARGKPSPRPEGFPAQGNASHIEQYNLSKRHRLRHRAPSEK